ncbi:hypothetical protein [Motilimonas pumila]|uniref:Uncharacterized protein n=1 Tax=Motilimonas pumila TaxID=2303987 RepID=A0A418YA42_9GAMM|nr:hypothetical protein [Motilimonas pumila]RJG38781.1 hypothetical protein D1Z90_18730 [Motilimonas pumila]
MCLWLTSDEFFSDTKSITLLNEQVCNDFFYQERKVKIIQAGFRIYSVYRHIVCDNETVRKTIEWRLNGLLHRDKYPASYRVKLHCDFNDIHQDKAIAAYFYHGLHILSHRLKPVLNQLKHCS